MNEKKIVDLEEFIELVKEPIEIKSETLGKLYFRRIFDDDFIFITNCLNENLDSEIFCKKLLLNQITNSSIELDDLNSLENNEIYFILKEYFKIEGIGENFDLNSSDDVYIVIKEGMTNYVNYVKSMIMNNQKVLLQSANAVMDAIKIPESVFSYLSDLNKASIEAMSISANAIEMANQFNLPDISNHVSNMINSSAALSATAAIEIVNQQVNIWKDMIAINKPIIQLTKNIATFWDNFQNNYHISSIMAQRCLKKYYWFISPNMDHYIVYEIIEICNGTSMNKGEEINNLLIDYFLENDCKNLDIIVDKWSFNPLFKGRIEIIKDCINLIKNNGNENINYSNLIVPTLIPQIEGIQNEFMKLNGFTINKYGTFKSDGTKIVKNDYFRQLTSDNEFFNAMNEIFLDVLFQKVHPGEECASINFSRHKILHGEHTQYGKKEHMIRCFMILDFLSELIYIKEE